MACGQSFDDAAKSLAAKVNARLAPDEVAHLTARNVSTMSPSDSAKVQAAMERALRKRARNAALVAVTLTISENTRGYLMVAQVRDAVEMASFRIELAERPKAAVDKKMIWEQNIPILDVAILDDQMLVLDSNGVTRYERRERAEAVSFPASLPRDPRGRMEISGESLTIQVAGSICNGTWKPLALKCESGGEFLAGRNTIESAGSPPYFSSARIGDSDLVAETDGRIHIYDSSHNPAGTFSDWGSDLAAACNATRALASSAADRDAHDFLALYEIANRAPVRVSDPIEFPGPVTALSSSLAVARNLSTGRYEAYSLTLDCGR